MFNDLISKHDPPLNRRKMCEGDCGFHLTEAAVMLAFAYYLLHSIPSVNYVAIHPDGEHAKDFDIHKWLEDHDFKQTQLIGKTGYSGTYVSGEKTIKVTSKPGIGDVEADAGGQKIVAECKGGKLIPDKCLDSGAAYVRRTRWHLERRRNC